MDLVDLRILKAMGIRYFGPVTSSRGDYAPAALATRVGLDEKTVRTRIERLHESGFLDGFDLFPNIRLFGMNEALTYAYGLSPEEKRTAFRHLEHVFGVTGAHDFYKGPLCVLFTFADEADKEARMDEIEEVIGKRPQFVCHGNAPEVKMTLSAFDWSLLTTLRHDALMPATEAAERLGVHAKTVRRRLAQLTRAKAYYIFPRLDPSKGNGFVFANIAVWPDETDRLATLERVRGVLDPQTFIELDPGVGNYLTMSAMASPSDADRIDAALARTEGVLRSEVDLMQGAMIYARWLDEALESRTKDPVPIETWA